MLMLEYTKMDRERRMTEAWSIRQEILSLAELNSNTKQNRNRVEMVQRRAARYVLNYYERYVCHFYRNVETT